MTADKIARVDIPPTPTLDGANARVIVPEDPKTPLPWQAEATQRVMETLEASPLALSSSAGISGPDHPLWEQNEYAVRKAQVRAACGMGKTVLTQSIIRALDDGDGEAHVILVPSIALAIQTRKALEEDGALGQYAVYSLHDGSPDVEAARSGAKGKGEIEDLNGFLANPLQSEGENIPRVVISTYQSLDRLIDAQGEHEFRTMIADESHRLSGDVKEKARLAAGKQSDADVPEQIDNLMAVIRNRGGLRAANKVYLSATPVYGDRYERSVSHTFASVDAGMDEPKVKNLIVNQSNPALFGQVAASVGTTAAVAMGRLAPLRTSISEMKVSGDRALLRTEANDTEASVTPRGSLVASDGPGCIPIAPWSGAVAVADAAATGSRRIILFHRGVNESKIGAEAFPEIARARAASLAGPGMTTGQAEMILMQGDSAPADRLKAAKMVWVAEYATSSHVDGTSSPAHRAHTIESLEDSSCRCGSPGGFCGCISIVNNVDILGQGIDVKAIDTVVVLNRDKTGDAPFTQSVGRAMRKYDGKDAGRLIVPVIELDDPADPTMLRQNTTLRILNGLRRLASDKVGVGSGSATQPLPSVQESTSGSMEQVQRDMMQVTTIDTGVKSPVSDVIASLAVPLDIAMWSQAVSGQIQNDAKRILIGKPAKGRSQADADTDRSLLSGLVGIPDGAAWKDLSPRQRHLAMMAYANNHKSLRTSDPKLEGSCVTLAMLDPSEEWMQSASVTSAMAAERVARDDHQSVMPREGRVMQAVKLTEHGQPRQAVKGTTPNAVPSSTIIKELDKSFGGQINKYARLRSSTVEVLSSPSTHSQADFDALFDSWHSLQGTEGVDPDIIIKYLRQASAMSAVHAA